MSCEQVHEGVRPRGSQTISALIDTAAAPSLMVAVVAVVAAAARGLLLSTSSCSLDCFCFQVTSYLLLQLFQFLTACCMKTRGGGGGRQGEVALAAGAAAARVNLHRDTAQKKHSETLLSDNLIK